MRSTVSREQEKEREEDETDDGRGKERKKKSFISGKQNRNMANATMRLTKFTLFIS